LGTDKNMSVDWNYQPIWFHTMRETLSERLGCLGFGFRSPVKQSVNTQGK